MKNFKNLIAFCIFCLIHVLAVAAPEHWMPDPVLRHVISHKLGVETLTIENMQRLVELDIWASDVPDGRIIENIKGLEHATNMRVLSVADTNISDLSPLSGLRRLTTLILNRSQIVNISPLSHLTQLEALELKNNQITDFTPLLNLTNLHHLDIRNNPHSGAGQFVSADPVIINALRNWMCHFERSPNVRPVKARIEGRNYPSIHVGATGAFKNAEGLETLKHFARASLFGDSHTFNSNEHGGLWFDKSPFGGFVRSGGGSLHIQDIKQFHEDLLHENPNVLFLAEIRYHDGYSFGFAENSPYWLRRADGTIVRLPLYVDAQGKESSETETLVDFTNPDVIEMTIAQAVAVANCGLYDGIMLDNWHETSGGLGLGLVPIEVEREARVKILQGIRQAVPDDFLIAVNTTWRKIPHSAPYVNGALMETWGTGKSTSLEWGSGRYTRQDYRNYEGVLPWYESNLKEPNFVALGAKVPMHTDRHSPENLQTVRALTTLSLTHSDGYVSVGQHGYGNIYYDFWDAPLGLPIGGDESKGVLYENPKGKVINGMFIREFTGGWAVYNRSGKEQWVYLPEKVTGWASGVENKHWHTLGDLDGEIYLKSVATPEDINADGIVNILDIVGVANNFGETEPDLNGDGVVNILDLVQISQALE